MTPPGARISLLFFDADGILYHRINKRQHLDQFLKAYTVESPDSESVWQATRSIRDSAHRGYTGRDALFDAILEAYGVTDPDLRQIGRHALADDAANISLYDGVVQTLRALQARGVKLGVITNSVTPSQEKLRWLETQGLELRWDVFVNSYEVGEHKPKPRIYEIALSQGGLPATETAFVAHDIAELATAHTVGMKTIAFQAPPDAQADTVISHFTELEAISL
jgi:HAD superfamily hydrolase (TIGR01509 family)